MKFWRKSTQVGFSVVAALTISMTSLYQVVHAATGTMYVSLSKSTAQKGDAVTADVRINPGTAVDTVTATVKFDSTRLSYQGVTYGGSPFSTQIPGSVTSNSLTFSSAYLGGSVSSDSFIARLSFTVIGSSGTASVSLTGNAARNGNATNPAVTGDSLTVTTQPQICPAGQIGTPPNCHSPVCPVGQIGTPPNCHSPQCPTGQVGTPPDCHTQAKCPLNQTGTPPHCSPITVDPVGGTGGDSGSHDSGGSTVGSSGSSTGSLKVSSVQIQYTVADMIVTTKGNVRVYIRYGLKSDALDTQTAMTGYSTVHKISFRKATILPGSTYFYQIVAKDKSGQVTTSKVDTFSTKGITVKIGVFDKKHHPFKHKKVSLHSTQQDGTTDSEGFVTFNGVAPGTHTLTYADNGKTYSQALVVDDNIQLVGGVQEADPQSFSVVYNIEQSPAVPYATIGIVLAGLLAVLVLAVVIKKRRSGGIYYGGGGGMSSGGDPAYGQVTVGGANAHQQYPESNYPPNGPSLTDRLDSIPPPQQNTPGTVISSNEQNDDVNKLNYS